MYISNTTDKEDGVLCFRDTNFTRATIPNPVNITCLSHGRNVIYYNNRTHPPYPGGTPLTLLMIYVKLKFTVRVLHVLLNTLGNKRFPIRFKTDIQHISDRSFQMLSYFFSLYWQSYVNTIENIT